jgi:Na+/melibiose symporter-like transporter
MVTGITFLEVLWTVMFASLWVGIIAFVVMVLVDNFRREDHSGWAKAGWTLFVIAFPLLGALVYQIARPRVVSTGPEWESRRRDEAMLPR